MCSSDLAPFGSAVCCLSSAFFVSSVRWFITFSRSCRSDDGFIVTPGSHQMRTVVVSISRWQEDHRRRGAKWNFSQCFSSILVRLMWRISATLNLVAVGLGIWAGCVAMDPETLKHTNPDAIVCSITFVIMIAFPVLFVSGNQAVLRRPSWRRFSINWSRDPLQCVFVSWLGSGAMALGAAVRLRGTTPTGIWTFMFFVCSFLGLLIGQFAVYVIYRDRIDKV